MLALAAAVAWAPGVAHAGFAKPATPIANAEQLNTGPKPVAVDGAGTTTVAWQQYDSHNKPVVKARRVSVTGAAGPVLDVSDADEVGIQPVVASTPGGRSMVAWRYEATDSDPSGVKARFIEPNGSLGPILFIVSPMGSFGAGALDVTFAPSGTATVMWSEQDDNKLYARRVTADGSLTISSPDLSGGGGVTNPRSIGLPNGSTLFVWRSGDAVANVVTANGTIGSAHTISSTNSPGDVSVAADAQGHVVAAWRRDDVSSHFTAVARRLDSSGATVGPEVIVDPSSALFMGLAVRVAADSNGHFLLTWNRHDSNGDTLAYARRMDATGTFAGAKQLISGTGADSNSPVPFLEDRGSAAVGWYRDASGGHSSQGRVLGAAAVPVGGVVDLVPNAGEVVSAGSPSVGVGAFLSTVNAASSAAISLNRYLVPPACSSSNAKVVQGKPIAVPLACSGPAIEGASVAAQPKHGKVGVFDAAKRALAYTPTPGFSGTDSFTYRATNDGGASNPATVTIKVGKDTVRPKITKLSFNRKKKRVKLTFSEPATATVKITKGKHAKKLGSVKIKTLGLSVSKKLSKKLRKKLAKGGRFRFTAVAMDAAGNKSKTKRKKVRIRRPA